MEGPLTISKRVFAELKEFSVNLPLIEALRGVGIMERHWRAMEAKTRMHLKPEYGTTLASLLDEYDILPHIAVISAIANRARHEYEVESTLATMESEWQTINFEFVAAGNIGMLLLDGLSTIVNLCEDQLVQLLSIRNSPHVGPHRIRVADWERQLLNTSEILEEVQAAQKSWRLLAQLMVSDDLIAHLPREARKYNDLDKKMRQIMDTAQSMPRVLVVMSTPRLLEMCKDCNKGFDEVTIGIRDYLNVKRREFPRFYFLSDYELLKIISNRDPQHLSAHISKLFHGIRGFVVEDDAILSLSGSDQESLTFSEPINLQQDGGDGKGGEASKFRPIHEVLHEIEKKQREEIIRSVHGAIASRIAEEMQYHDWVVSSISQAVETAEDVVWNRAVLRYFATPNATRLAAIRESIKDELHSLFAILGKCRIDAVHGKEMNESTRFHNIENTILARLSHQSVLDVLERNKVQAESSFFWVSRGRVSACEGGGV